jgi:hypothetical protein
MKYIDQLFFLMSVIFLVWWNGPEITLQKIFACGLIMIGTGWLCDWAIRNWEVRRRAKEQS